MRIIRRAGARGALAHLRLECAALRFQRTELANENGDLRLRLAVLEAQAAVTKRENRDMKLRLQAYRRDAIGRANDRPRSTPLTGPLKAHGCLELDA